MLEGKISVQLSIGKELGERESVRANSERHDQWNTASLASTSVEPKAQVEGRRDFSRVTAKITWGAVKSINVLGPTLIQLDQICRVGV